MPKKNSKNNKSGKPKDPPKALNPEIKQKEIKEQKPSRDVELVINSANENLEKPAFIYLKQEQTNQTQHSSKKKEEIKNQRASEEEIERQKKIEIEHQRQNEIPFDHGNAQNEAIFEDNSVFEAEKFILNNTIGKCQDYDLANELDEQSCFLYDEQESFKDYQKVLEKMQKSDMIAQCNSRITKESESNHQLYPKVKLKIQRNVQRDFVVYEKWVIIKAVVKSDFYSLEEKLITGRRFCIITKKVPFKSDHLRKNNFSTYLCFVGKDKQFGLVASGLEEMEIPPISKEQWEAETPENHEDENRKLKRNQYFLIDLGSIVSNIREYSALENCKDNPLMKSIYTNFLEKYYQYKGKRNNSNKIDFFTPEGKKNRRKLNRQQAYTVQKIGQIKKGISLIQGLPGTGKTEIIAEIAQNEVFQSRSQPEKSLDKLKNKVMICSTSSAAADSIYEKLLMYTKDWKIKPPKILRVSYAEQVDAMHLSSNFHHLREINALGTEDEPDEWSATLRFRKKRIQEKIGQIKAEYGKSERRRLAIKHERQQIFKIEESIVKVNKAMSKKWHFVDEIQRDLMEGSDIIICTLNTSGMKKIAKFYKNRVRCLLIDDANQATEVSTLIPFATLVEKVVLVGNKYQLLPTVKTKLEAYKKSLFYRLGQYNHYFNLNIQFRMSEEIMKFPNDNFYKGNLKLSNKQNHVPSCLSELQHKSMFFNVTYGNEEERYMNRAEARCIMTVIDVLTDCSEILTIGIIAAYKDQVGLIQSQISRLNLRDQLRKNVVVDTIQAFQGQQKDVIIFSTVRSSSAYSVGSLNDKKRLNLAFTRAKSAFFVFGSEQALSKSQIWRIYIDYQTKRGAVREINYKNSRTFFTS